MGQVFSVPQMWGAARTRTAMPVKIWTSQAQDGDGRGIAAALANQFPLEDIYEREYRGNSTTDPGETPQGAVPALTDRVYALHEVVKVDLKLPGCPTTPEIFVGALMHLLKGAPFDGSGKDSAVLADFRAKVGKLQIADADKERLPAAATAAPERTVKVSAATVPSQKPASRIT